MLVTYALIGCCVTSHRFLVLRTVRHPRSRETPLRPPFPSLQRRMSWWSRLLGGTSKEQPRTRRADYLGEAIARERQRDLEAALTPYRSAQPDQPNEPSIPRPV